MSLSRRTAHRARLAGLALGLALVATGLPLPAIAAELPPGPTSPAPAPDPIDAYVPYEGQTGCDPVAKPGTVYLLSLVRTYYGIGRNAGLNRACDSGGQSEHKDGRAFDWGLNVDNPAEKAAGDAFVTWLTAVGPDGKVGYNARRLGVMYVIWNRQIWNNSSASSGWREYTGPSPHTDHVHVSLSWNGAWMRSSWWTGVAIPEVATTRRYVSLVYEDLFGRKPDPSGLTSWTNALTSATPRVAVAQAITSSQEYRTGLIQGVYRDFLGREPDEGGLVTWLNAMALGFQIQDLEAGFLASPEYYAQVGNDDVAWVQRLYLHVLGRPGGADEVGSWVAQLAQGQSREAIARGFVRSTERLSSVINGYYVSLLGRTIDPTGLQTWVGAIQGGNRSEEIIGGIISSAEYYLQAEFPR